MTPEEQRICIAEACGWLKIHNANTMAACGIWVGYDPKNAIVGKPQELPDYFNDLNAMAEAEKVGILHSNELTLEYFNQLSKFMSPNARSIQDSAKIFCATAAQRAEAFLRTIGKWKD